MLYLSLAAWQIVWHGLLPAPLGAQRWWLAAAALLPLLFPLQGIAGGRPRSLVWGAYLALLYFIIGVTEAWSNPAQRLAASVQIGLSTAYVLAVILVSRRRTRPAG